MRAHSGASDSIPTEGHDADVLGWTIWRGDGDATDVILIRERDRSRACLLNGLYPTRLDALEAAVDGALADLDSARSRVRKLKSRLRYEARKARTAAETGSPGTQPGLPGEVKQSPANQEQGQSE